MAIWNKHFFEKYPDAQVPDPENDATTFWVDFGVVYDHLVAEGKGWVGEGAVEKAYLWCSDRPEANVLKVQGQGWVACTRKQARQVAEDLDLKDHVGPGA